MVEIRDEGSVMAVIYRSGATDGRMHQIGLEFGEEDRCGFCLGIIRARGELVMAKIR